MPTKPPAPRPSDPPAATLRVGIALGTWRTAVASSAGAREHFGSLAGWPKSASARKMIGEDVVVGAEAYRYRVALDLSRPFEGGVVPGHGALRQVHLRAAADLIRRAVRIAGATPGERASGVLAVPAKAAWESRDELVKAAADTMTVTDVVPEAWAAGCGAGAAEGAIVVDAGASSTVVCRCGAQPPAEKDAVILPGGGDAIDMDLLARLQERLPAGEFTIAGVRELKERYGCLLDSDSALVGLPVAGAIAPVDVAAPVAAACRAQVPGILEAIRSLLPGKKTSATVVLAGCGGLMKGLDRLLAEGLKALGGGTVTRVISPVFAGAEGALALATRK